MRILVTGGFGFIGSWLIERLLGDGHQVHVVDDLSSNPIPPGKVLDELGHPEGLTFSISDIADFAWNRLPRFDQIYHLASPVGPAGILPFAGRMVWQVVNDIYTLIALTQRDGARLIDVSTSEVYGGGQNGLCSEDMPRVIQAKTTVRLEYAVAKLAAETAILNTEGLDAVVVRPFNVAGPRQSPKGGFVLPRFIEQAMRGEALTVFGDGSAVRAFTHVREIADGIYRAGQYGNSGEVYNLGNSFNRITILELAQKVIEIVGQGTIVHVDPTTIYGPRYAEAADKYPDAGRARMALAWHPQMTIDEIIRDALDYQMKGVTYAHDGAANR